MNKVNGFWNPVDGAVFHSMEGYSYTAWTMVINPNLRVSWHFSVQKDGSVWQHYPINAQCWHSGVVYGNQYLIGIEHEGIAGQALTVAQRNSSIALGIWLSQQGGWQFDRSAYGGLWEHRELNTSTSCPSSRIPWNYYVIEDPDPEPEPDLPADLQPMDFSETLVAVEAMNNDFSDVGSDQNGNAMLRVVSIPGLTIPAGKRAVVAIIDDWDVD
jgi:hypothetical protein